MGARGPKPDPARAAARARLSYISDKSFTTLWNAKKRLDRLERVGAITIQQRRAVEINLIPSPDRKPSIRRFAREARELQQRAQRDHPELFREAGLPTVTAGHP